MTKKFIALARVSSREQEHEGFSLDVQEEAIKKYAERVHGEIIKPFRIAETASKHDERKTFKELIGYAKHHADELDGILFYKVDRAARNFFDYVELERLESEYGVQFISVAQPTENTPAGRMQRRMLANMASFYTEQQSIDVKAGLARRVETGLFVNKAPYGYRNVRRDGRGLIERHPENARKVRLIFELFAYHRKSVEEIGQILANEGHVYLPSRPRFAPSTIYHILNDRSYIGEVKHRGKWYPGTQEHLIDQETWHRAQVRLGKRVYCSHEMPYAGELIVCGYCGYPVTGEAKIKMTKSGEKRYRYYRCSRYSAKEHPRIRVTEEELEGQILDWFDDLEPSQRSIRQWFSEVWSARNKATLREARERAEELKRQLTLSERQQDQLLNMRLMSEITPEQFAAKQAELYDRQTTLEEKLLACEYSEKDAHRAAARAADLFDELRARWPTADVAIKRRILGAIFAKLILIGKTLVADNRTPFELLSAG